MTATIASGRIGTPHRDKAVPLRLHRDTEGPLRSRALSPVPMRPTPRCQATSETCPVARPQKAEAMTKHELRQAAIRAHRAGESFAMFLAEYGPAMREREPFDRERYHRLSDELLGLAVAGNEAGRFAVGDDPWDRDDEHDDVQHDEHDVNDSVTAARAPDDLMTQTSFLDRSAVYQ